MRQLNAELQGHYGGLRNGRRHRHAGRQRGATNGWTEQSGPCAMLPSMAAFAFMPTPDLSLKMAGNEKMPLLYWYGVWCDANAAMECAHKEPDAPYEIHGGMIGSGDHMNMGNATYNWEALNMLDFCSRRICGIPLLQVRPTSSFRSAIGPRSTRIALPKGHPVGLAYA